MSFPPHYTVRILRASIQSFTLPSSKNLNFITAKGKSNVITNPRLPVLNSFYLPIIFKEILKPFLMLPVIIPLYLTVDDIMKKI